MANATNSTEASLDFFVTPFIEPTSVNNSQLLFLTLVYALILYQSSNLISNGSELLMVDERVAPIVGSVVLPILGAVPDGVMTLFSGLGEDAQKEVSLGVGVLAGSTVMLLTFPWFIAVFCGAVPQKENGGADYSKKESTKKKQPWCVEFNQDVPSNAKFMLFSTLIYVLIQVPAYLAESSEPHPLPSDPNYTSVIEANQEKESKSESKFALIGLVLSTLLFIVYLVLQVVGQNNPSDDKAVKIIIEEIDKQNITLATALSLSKKMDDESAKAGSGGPNEPLLANNAQEKDKTEAAEKEKAKNRLRKIVRPFFHRYDTSGDKQLNKTEFSLLMADLGEPVDKNGPEVETIFKAVLEKYNSDTDELINLKELVDFLYDRVRDPEKFAKLKAEHEKGKEQNKTQTIAKFASKDDEQDDDAKSKEEDDDDEDEEVKKMKKMVEDGKMKRSDMIKAIWFRASWMMLLGVTVVLIVSDPFVDVLNVWGNRLGIPGFYVSFVIAPFASNASELLSAYNYAVKKTRSAMTTALSTLVGAACMNNTFVLAIFFALLYFKNLAWEFTAETIAIIAVQWLIGLLAIFKNVHNYVLGVVILMCYPLCLAIVAGLEAQGFD